MAKTKSGNVNSASVHLRHIQGDMAQAMADNGASESFAPRDDGAPPPLPSTTDFDSTGDPIQFGLPVFGSTPSGELGQSFTTDGNSGQISDLQLCLLSNDPGDGGTLTVSLWSDSGAAPGIDIGVLGTIADSALTGSPAEYDITLTGNTEIDPNTRYWVELGTSGNNAGNDAWAGTHVLGGPEVASEYNYIFGTVGTDASQAAFIMSVSTEPPPGPGTNDFDSTGDSIDFGAIILDGTPGTNGVPGNDLGQSFSTDANSGQISDLQLELQTSDPSDGGTISVSLWSDNGDSPGTEIGVLGTIADSALSNSPSLYDIALTGNTTVDPNTRYWVEVCTPNSNVGNDQWLGTANPAGPEVASEFSDYNGFIGSDLTVGAFLMYVNTAPPPCYAAGTRILTDRGEVAVENLRAGDRVMALLRGRLAAVRWVGQRTVDVRRHAAPDKVRPVRIRAGAFAPGEPHRDLVVSPDHALYVDGALVVARHLINGATIVQESPDRITYYHVELDAHDVLLAEGLPAETYLDTGNRASFENGGASIAAHPDFARSHDGRPLWRTKACAPMLDTPAQRAPVRQRLLARAGELGHLTTHDPDLRVLARGQILRPNPTEEGAGFDLPPHVARVRLLSRTARGCETIPHSMDSRCLGICVHQIALDGVAVSLDDARLSAGWHARESIWRWTDGDAVLEIAGARSLWLQLCGKLMYWVAEPAFDRRATMSNT